MENFGNDDVDHHDGRDDDDNFGTQAILLLCAAVSVSAELLVGHFHLAIFTQPFLFGPFCSAIFAGPFSLCHFHPAVFTRPFYLGHFLLGLFHSAIFYCNFHLANLIFIQTFSLGHFHFLIGKSHSTIFTRPFSLNHFYSAIFTPPFSHNHFHSAIERLRILTGRMGRLMSRGGRYNALQWC